MPKAPKQHRIKPDQTGADPVPRRDRTPATPGPLASCQLVTDERQRLQTLFGPAIQRRPGPPPALLGPVAAPVQRQDEAQEDEALQGQFAVSAALMGGAAPEQYGPALPRQPLRNPPSAGGSGTAPIKRMLDIKDDMPEDVKSAIGVLNEFEHLTDPDEETKISAREQLQILSVCPRMG